MLALTPVRAVAVDRPVSSNSLVFTMLELRLAAAAADTLYDPLVLTGRATWYDARKNDAWFTERPRPGAEGRNQDGAPYRYYAAAGPALREARDFRWGKEPYEVILRNPATGREITVTVVDWCQCHGGEAGNERLIDLAPAAFKALGVPLARGVQRIELRFVKSGITLEELLLSPAPGAIPGDAPFGTDELDAPWSAEEPDGEFLPPSPF
jgi:hypothetical protein